ncbi:hypothetical protein V5799_020574 [Amblyomma americanum]|uniref:Secreted protein n=1 Tax=Amblyomma americanum TaxID=6943 RepID=A0AAQ4EUA7_AMBAM
MLLPSSLTVCSLLLASQVVRFEAPPPCGGNCGGLAGLQCEPSCECQYTYGGDTGFCETNGSQLRIPLELLNHT